MINHCIGVRNKTPAFARGFSFWHHDIVRRASGCKHEFIYAATKSLWHHKGPGSCSGLTSDARFLRRRVTVMALEVPSV
jgi:hypothetical protein